MRRRLKSPKYSLISVWKGDWGTADLEVCYHDAAFHLRLKGLCLRPEKVTEVRRSIACDGHKAFSYWGWRPLPVQIYSNPCCFHSSALGYAPKQNGLPHVKLKGGKEDGFNGEKKKHQERVWRWAPENVFTKWILWIQRLATHVDTERVVSAGWINEMPVVVWLCGKGKFWWKQRAPCSSRETLESFHKKHWHFL